MYSTVLYSTALYMNKTRSLAKKLITDKKINIEKIASASGYSYSHVSNWLKGKDVPADTEAKFKKALGTHVQL